MHSFGLSNYHYPHGTKNQEGLGQLLQVNSISGRDDECGKNILHLLITSLLMKMLVEAMAKEQVK